MDDPIRLAALNNAEWCDAICRAHGRPCTFGDALWFNRQATPPFYPNAVTLARDSRPAIEQALPLIQAGAGAAFAIKDSYQSLDLRPLGFDPLFEAEWILRAPTPSTADRGDISWRVVETERQLAAWETAWAGGVVDEPIFRVALLADPAVTLIAGFDGDHIVAGAALNRSAAAMGWSNVFAPEADGLSPIAGALAFATTLAGDLPLVGYEHGEALEKSMALGFEPVGGLRIWAYRQA
ncbi:hypothetical protein OSH11_20190 [Kaistia dalseonensis]|uniref:GNAT family N-acetyltransferase n=1 Tax=Kaistia dalseonensis TaxID=410840 RepID=A0ABU0HCJ1_9HYPH|nr:hypothetical protein [Kaistia dalseonensis]MCX5497036.1 hypothetical protein [Kaistia dalseonensis]MDQ0439662.1 hypothetical protein [Kaistia dalseonensis]